MWSSHEIVVEVAIVHDDVMLVEITTPVGTVEALGRSGLNAICRKLMEEADVDQIVIEGGARSTGKNRGRIPKPFKYP